MNLANLFKRRRFVEPEALDIPDVFRLSEEPLPDDITDVAEWDLDMSLPVRKISALFVENGWLLQVGDSHGIPLPWGIAAFIAEQCSDVDDLDGPTYSTLGRMMFFKDDEQFPGTVDMYLHLGTATRKPEQITPDDLEELS